MRNQHRQGVRSPSSVPSSWRPDPSSGEVRESRTGRPGGIRDRCGDLIAGRERDRRRRYHRPGVRIRRPVKFANREPGALAAVVVV